MDGRERNEMGNPFSVPISNRSQSSSLSQIVDFKLPLVGETQNSDVHGEIDRQNDLAELEELKEINKKLKDDLMNLREINVKLNKTHSALKSTLERESEDTRIKFNGLIHSHETELKRLNREKREMLDEMKVTKKANEDAINIKQMVDKLFKMLEESQSQIASLTILNKSLSYAISTLVLLLDNCEIRTNRALECLVDERRTAGNLIIKIASDKTLASIRGTLKELSLCSVGSEYVRLENTRKTQEDYFKNLISIQRDFSDKMNNCSHSLKTNKDEFEIENIPPIPIRDSKDARPSPSSSYDILVKSQKSTEGKKTKSVLKDTSSVSEASNIQPTSSKMWKKNDKTGGYISSNDCSICMEPLSKGAAFRVECGHNCFHEKCVSPWLRENGTCPICKKYLILPDDFPKL